MNIREVVGWFLAIVGLLGMIVCSTLWALRFDILAGMAVLFAWLATIGLIGVVMNWQ